MILRLPVLKYQSRLSFLINKSCSEVHYDSICTLVNELLRKKEKKKEKKKERKISGHACFFCNSKQNKTIFNLRTDHKLQSKRTYCSIMNDQFIKKIKN